MGGLQNPTTGLSKIHNGTVIFRRATMEKKSQEEQSRIVLDTFWNVRMTNDDAVRRRKEHAEQMNEPAAAAAGSDQSRLRPAGQTPAASSWKTR